MKDLFKNIFLAASVVAAMISCDIIDDPLKEGGTPPTPPSGDTVLRKIIIEDFTGHQCKNCPDAAKKIKELEGFYGEQVIGIAIHAKPSHFTGTTADYPTDFRTPEGIEIYDFFGIPALPLGMVSRKDWSATGTAHLKTYPSWPTQTAALIDDTAKFKLEITASFDESSRDVSAEVEMTALEDYSTDVKIVVMLLESNIVSPQLMPDGTRNPDYVHNHVLRDALTPAMGEAFAQTPIALDATFNGTFSGNVSTDWNENEMDILVYVYDADTQEILQAEIAHIKE